MALKKPGKGESERIVLESYRIVRKYVAEHYKDDPVAKQVLDKFRVSVDSYTSNMAAATNPETAEVYINIDVMWYNMDHLEKVIMHEFVHVYLQHSGKNGLDHGDDFKDEMNRIGFTGAVVRHDFLPTYEFVYKCKSCKDELTFYSRMNQEAVCLSCGNEGFSFKIKRSR